MSGQPDYRSGSASGQETPMTHAGEPLPDASGRITRRHLLELGTKGALVIGGGAGLAACGGGGGGSDTGSSASATGTPAAGTATRGGTLKIGMITAGDSETINPAKVVNVADLLRIAQIYDYLFGVGEDVKTLVPKLALSA